MDEIDGPKLAEFLDEHKNKPLDRERLRTDLELLKSAGVSVSKDSIKFGRKVRTLEYFLLRSHLYQVEGKALIPHFVKSNWTDFTKTWKTKFGEKELHVPFLGKIAFICSENGIKRIMCHPDSVSSIDKILVDVGKLTLQRDPDRVNLMYNSRTCRTILNRYHNRELTEEFLMQLSSSPFGRLLLSLKLARKDGEILNLVDQGLLLDEVEKLEGEDELEKAARILLRREQEEHAQIASVIIALENLERQIQPWEKPIGQGPRYRESKRTRKRHSKLDYYQLIEGLCSLDARAATNAFLREGRVGFSRFGTFLGVYHKLVTKAQLVWVQSFAFLSWYTDPLVHLIHSPRNLSEKLHWPFFKAKKTEKHRQYLLKFVDEKSLVISSRKDLQKLKERLKASEFIDMNVNPDKLEGLGYSFKRYSEVAYCSSNIFVASNVSVDRNLFESTAVDVLKSPSRFKDSQGAFYYADFRFLMASRLGLSLKTVDKILAYLISIGSELGGRLWFFPAFGRVPRRDRPDWQLVDVIQKPFDSVALNY